MHDSSPHWNELHANPRFRPAYPSEHVVRFLLASRVLVTTTSPPRFLDIGLGAGRHLKLAAELGFLPHGIDISLVGLKHAHQRLVDAKAPHGLAVASMSHLPFADLSFYAVLSYGVFYYGRAEDMKQAIREAQRVLVAGGKLFVVLRSTGDYRFGKGRELERNTFQLEIADTNELGTIQHFLTADDIARYFLGFSHVSFERNETTFSNRLGVNSDWLITAEK